MSAVFKDAPRLVRMRDGDLGEVLEIENAIPVGRMSHDTAAWQHAPDELRDTGQALMDRYATTDAPVHTGTVACQMGRWAAATTSSRSAWTPPTRSD